MDFLQGRINFVLLTLLMIFYRIKELSTENTSVNVLHSHIAKQKYSDQFELFTESSRLPLLGAYSENVFPVTDTNSKVFDKDRVINESGQQYLESVAVETTSVANTVHKILNNDDSTGSMEEISKHKSLEYEERPSGTILDEFISGKLSTSEGTNTLPIFLTEPESVYVVKNRPAILKCKAAHALQLHFKCSGSSQPPPSTHDKHVDPHTGVHLEEVVATIHRDLVDEYFGKGPFKCECHAWSSRGVVKSQSATISIAYMRKQFATSPTSLRVEVGSRAELYCEPPDGYPTPKISWYKNNAAMTATNEKEFSISVAGTLTFHEVILQDMANYTCSAENIAGKRTSDTAVLIIYENGGWSSWSSWKECKCSNKASQGRKRTRTCTNPVPLNGGSQCLGPQIQKSPDCISCPEDTQIVSTDGFEFSSNKRCRWSSWSEWSACSRDCVQIRRRKCISTIIDEGNDINLSVSNSGSMTSGNGANTAVNVKLQCSGKDIQTAECRGGLCHIAKDEFDWALYLGLAFVTAVCFAFIVVLFCCARRSIWAHPHYNITRTVMDSEYMQGSDKKEMRMHIEAINVSYDYPNAASRYNPNDYLVSEHHYDVPNLSANYTNPIDELNVDYLTDTPDTSTADTSNSTYDATAVKLPTINSSNSVVCESLSSNGGCLLLYNGEIMLYVPELAMGKNQKKYITLMLLSDDRSKIPLHSSESNLVVCSTIAYCAPRCYNFLKPVILKIPHCLVDPDLWNVNIYHADNDHDDVNIKWRKITVVGEETINTPIFVQIEPTHVYIMTEQLGHFVVIADVKPCLKVIQPSIKMKLIAFNQIIPSSTSFSLRIYVVKYFPNSKDSCKSIESQLGGTYMGESEEFVFILNNCNLNIRVNSDDSWETQDSEMHEQTIPYNHILSNNSFLHCEFSIKLQQQINKIMLNVDFVQYSSDTQLEGKLHSFCITNQRNVPSDTISESHQTMVSVDRQGNYINETTANLTGSMLNNIQLTRATKRRICAALDPPRSDERDWRLLAKKLNTDRYIAYFATKPSPTEQILNLWECRASNSSQTIIELLSTLKDMDRQDVMDIITETIGPLWI